MECHNMQLSEEEETSTEPKVTKGRGRPLTTGKYVGLAKSQAALNAAKKEELLVSSRRDSRYKRISESPSEIQVEDAPGCGNTVDQIQQQVAADVAITEVATKSDELEETFVRELKDALASITRAVKVLTLRTISDEKRQLQAENARLQTERDSLRKELSSLKGEMERARKQGCPAPYTTDVTKTASPATQPQAASLEEIYRAIMSEVETMVNASFRSIEDRLLPEKRLRPPLAVDRRREAVQTTWSAETALTPWSGPNWSEEGPAPPETYAPMGKKSKKVKKKPKAAAPGAAKPNAAKPDTAKTDTAKPDAAKPKKRFNRDLLIEAAIVRAWVGASKSDVNVEAESV